MKFVFRVSVLALMMTVAAGCMTSARGSCASRDDGRPSLKVGVYAGKGPGGIGAVEWFRLVEESPEMELRLLDGKSVREGGLDGLDLLVMPGGNSKTEFTSLGTNGVERLKAFVREGGGYLGTCAGCCLLMDGPDRRARMMPWNTCGSEGGTTFPSFKLNKKGAKALGLKEGLHVMRYHGGPCMWPTTNVIEGADFELWGTFNAEFAMKGKIGKRMFGSAAIIGGKFGKGRVFVTSGHPEYFNSTLYIVKAAIKYVTGRDVTFPPRRRTPRAVAVGFLSKGISGVETAETALAIAKDNDLDLVLIDADGINQRRLDHIDVLVLTNDSAKGSKAIVKAVDEFAANGGKVVGYGGGAKWLPKGGVACPSRGGTVKAIRDVMGL